MCQFINTFYMEDKCSWPLSSALGREGHIAHIPLPNHSFSGSKAKCSQPLGAAQEERYSENFCTLIGQFWRVGWVSMRREVAEL